MPGLPKRHAARDDTTESPQVERHGTPAGDPPVPESSPSGAVEPPAAPDGQQPATSPTPEAPTGAIDPLTGSAAPTPSGVPGDAGRSDSPAAAQAPLTEAPAPPASPDPTAPIVEPGVAEPEQPGVRHRAQLRRRLRFLRRRRELELRDLGGLVFDLSRFGAQRPDLLQAKVEVLATTDAERRALEQALGEDRPLRELREAGIGGVCPACGTLYASDARFCSSCGAPLAAPGP